MLFLGLHIDATRHTIGVLCEIKHKTAHNETDGRKKYKLFESAEKRFG